MSITQTVFIPADRRLTIEVPREVPSGATIITFTPAPKAETLNDCPLCAKHRDTVTGELSLSAETIAAIEEVDDMLAGKIPNTLKSFNSLEEMLADLDSDD